MMAATLLSGTVFGQPTSLPKINPANGLLESSSEELTPEGALNAGFQTGNEVHKLIFNHQYEEALQRCLAFHNKWKTSASLISLLGNWVELGRRYPKAKQALIEIRDRDTREFNEGRGYFELFMEVSSINRELEDEDATYALYRSFRDKDRKLGGQCLGFVEGLLVSKGEYQWCYDHMGDPQARFEYMQRTLNMRLNVEERQREAMEASQKRLEDMRRQHGRTNGPAYSPLNIAAGTKSMAHDSFVSQTLELIEILVATGHKDTAEKIRDQAAAAVDDARLKTAVNDAEIHIRKQTRAESESVVVNPS
jgi:hypothetical protein